MIIGALKIFEVIDYIKLLMPIENLIFIRCLKDDRCDKDLIFYIIAGVDRVAQFPIYSFTMRRKQFQVPIQTYHYVKIEKRLIALKIILIFRIVIVAINFQKVLTLNWVYATGFTFVIFYKQILTELIAVYFNKLVLWPVHFLRKNLPHVQNVVNF